MWSKFQEIDAKPMPPETDSQNFNQEMPNPEILGINYPQLESLKVRFGPQFTVQTIKLLYDFSLRTPGISVPSPGFSVPSPGGTFSPGGFSIFEEPGFFLQTTRIPFTTC